MSPEHFIKALNKSDPSFATVFMYGSCYRFHLLLKEFFDTATPLINEEKNHVVTEINGQCFDITGLVESQGYSALNDSDIELVNSWSFHKHMLLSLGECQSCDEPILTAMHLPVPKNGE